ncbi:MAG: hypothetical protein AUK56_08225 [Thiomicrospira sp. CG2_30_44_34]|nr:MAG: hypothetical protein AUK56_08225 [Thiomicrospira sp. CG2_30_44_34]
MIQLYTKKLSNWLGVLTSPVSHTEKWVSAFGGFLAIAVMVWITHQFLDLDSSLAVMASMGATAVLLFAVPHSPLSQPWPVIGGNLISGTIGITCSLYIEPAWLAAGLAVGLAIISMYYLNCLHPPAGATALLTVLGSEPIHHLGYQFLLTPVLLNLILILTVAVSFNRLFYWRRYPIFLQKSKSRTIDMADSLSHEDFLAALKSVDSFVDIHEADLKRILGLALAHRQTGKLKPEQIHLGGVYSNGKLGRAWSMRRIVDESKSDDPNQDFVIFKQIAGNERKTTDCITRTEFAHWAKHAMVMENGLWHRQDDPLPSKTTSSKK